MSSRLFTINPFLLFGLATLAGCAGSNNNGYASQNGRSQLLGARAASRAHNERQDVAVDKLSTLDREKLIRAVLARNPGVESRLHAWHAARARKEQVDSLDDPMLSYSFAPLSIFSQDVHYGQVIRLSQRFPWPGQLSGRGAAAEAMAEAAEQQIEVTQLELALTASKLFDDYYLVDRSLEINEQHRRLLGEIKRSAEAQYEVGRGGLQDPLQAEVELTRLEQEAIMLRSRRQMIIAQLNTLLHREPNKPLPPPPRKLDIPAQEPTEAADALQQAALKQRAELSAASAEIRAAEREIEVADREYYPDITLMAEYNSMWNMPEHQFMVGIELPIPLQRGKRGGAADQASAQAAEARSEARRLSDEVRREVEMARLKVVETMRVAKQYPERLIPTARAQVDAARSGYTSGTAPFVAVIDAEKSLRDFELGYHVALVEVSKSWAELARALGGIPGSADTGGGQ